MAREAPFPCNHLTGPEAPCLTKTSEMPILPEACPPGLRQYPMNAIRRLLENHGRSAVLAAALLLVGALGLAGVHHHGDSSEHGCAICTLSHTPATTTVAGVPIVVPTGFARILRPPTLAPRSLRL